MSTKTQEFVKINAFKHFDAETFQKGETRLEVEYLGSIPHNFINKKTGEVEASYIHAGINGSELVRFTHKAGFAALLNLPSGTNIVIIHTGQVKNDNGGFTQQFDIFIPQEDVSKLRSAYANKQLVATEAVRMIEVED